MFYVPTKLEFGQNTFYIWEGGAQEKQPTDSVYVDYEPYQLKADSGYAVYWCDGSWHYLPDIRQLKLEDLKSVATAAASDRYDTAINILQLPYHEEAETWSTQLEEAKKILEGKESQLLATLAQASGDSVRVLAIKVLEKANAYQSSQFDALIAYKSDMRKIAQAKSLEELPHFDIYDLNKAFPSAHTEIFVPPPKEETDSK